MPEEGVVQTEKSENSTVFQVNRVERDGGGLYYVNLDEGGESRHFISKLSQVLELIDQGVVDQERILSLTMGELYEKNGNEFTFTYNHTEPGAVILNRSKELGPFSETTREAVMKKVDLFKENSADPYVLILMRQSMKT